METEPGNPSRDYIVRLQTGDLPALCKLLTDSGLPADDCAAPQNQFFGIFDNRQLLAAGGLETADGYSLLRSLVVAPQHRGRGLARALTEFLLATTRARRCSAVFLLTETAAAFFETIGFVKIPRDQVPPAIAATRQFADLCPDSAECLMLPLTRS